MMVDSVANGLKQRRKISVKFAMELKPTTHVQLVILGKKEAQFMAKQIESQFHR
jgi:hypothetical protein